MRCEAKVRFENRVLIWEICKTKGFQKREDFKNNALFMKF